ncbi:unnamed protein product, partial [Coregonus sp. 'balchen']
MLDVPALLLTTLEEFTEEQLKTFQSNLTSVQLPGFPLIPESQLENTDRQDTVDQMVKRYGPERAVEITLNTMRKMDLGDLAEKLERDHRGDSPLLLEPNDPIVGQAFTLPSATDGTMEEESQDCVRVHLSDSLPEAMDELNITECRVVDQSLCTTDPHMRSPENFEPEIYDREDKGAYRFQCLRSGLCQCSITGLVFRMEGEGEVLYRTVPWNRRLLAKRGKRPAGPLFNIDCSQKSVCQLHLPHCEIHSEGGCDFLSVAHETDDDSMEFLRPHETTETHVILNINGFSKYGITKDMEAPVSPIRGLVLLFYQLPDDTNNSTLNVLLLPRNVDIDELIFFWKNMTVLKMNVYGTALFHYQIIINITGFSDYGLTKDEAPVFPIQGLVLLFYQLFVPEERSILNVLLLPSNVVIREVQDERKTRNGDKETLIETTPHCNLTPNKPYILSTNITHGYRINPTYIHITCKIVDTDSCFVFQTAEFVDFQSYENYFSTFQLFLKTVVKEFDLLLKEKGSTENVWNGLVWLPGNGNVELNSNEGVVQ